MIRFSIGQIGLTDMGLIIIMLGMFLIIIGIMMSLFKQGNTDDYEETHVEGKAIILIGPIPIILGWGKKAYIISLIGIVILVLYWLFFSGWF